MLHIKNYLKLEDIFIDNKQVCVYDVRYSFGG